MSKAVILSIHPKWAKLIYEGKKTIEWRKSVPKKCEDYSKIFLYETAPVCTVTGFVELTGFDAVSPKMNRIDLGGKRSDKENEDAFDFIVNFGCVSKENLKKYQGKADYIYAWYINFPQKFLTPKTLADFKLKRPPQSWCYTEVEV